MGCGASSSGAVVEKKETTVEDIVRIKLDRMRADGAKEIIAMRIKRNILFRKTVDDATKAIGPLVKHWACAEYPSDNTEPYYIPPSCPTHLTQRVPSTDPSVAGKLIFRRHIHTTNDHSICTNNIPRILHPGMIKNEAHIDTGGIGSSHLCTRVCTNPEDVLRIRAMFSGCLSSYSCGYVRLPKEPVTRMSSVTEIRRASIEQPRPVEGEKETSTSDREHRGEELVAARGPQGGLYLSETRGYISSRKPTYDVSVDGDPVSPIGGLFSPSAQPENVNSAAALVADCATEDEVSSVVSSERDRLESSPMELVPRKLEKYFLYPHRITAMGIKLSYRVTRTVVDVALDRPPNTITDVFEKVNRTLLEDGVRPKDGYSVPLTTFFRNVSHVVESQAWRTNFRIQQSISNRNSRVEPQLRALPDCFATFHAPMGRCRDESMFSELFARTETSLLINQGIPLEQLCGSWWPTLQQCASEDVPTQLRAQSTLRSMYDSNELLSGDDLYWLALRRHVHVWIIAVMSTGAEEAAQLPDSNVHQTTIEMKLGLVPAHSNTTFIAFNGFGNSNTVSEEDGAGLFNGNLLPSLREYHDPTRPQQLMPFHLPVAEGTFSTSVRHHKVSSLDQMAAYIPLMYREVLLLDILLKDVLGDVFTMF